MLLREIEIQLLCEPGCDVGLDHAVHGSTAVGVLASCQRAVLTEVVSRHPEPYPVGGSADRDIVVLHYSCLHHPFIEILFCQVVPEPVGVGYEYSVVVERSL